jgi:sugar transferase (PEP-CTERM system associated)
MAFIKRVNTRALTLIALESALILGAVAVAAGIRGGVDEPWQFFASPDRLLKGCLIAAVCQFCLYINDLYDLRVVAHRGELVVRILQSLSATSVLLAVAYFWFPALVVGRGVFIIAALLTMTLVAGWRLAFEWIARRTSPRERLLIVGTNESAVTLAREIHSRRLELGVEIAGFIDGNPARVGESLFNPRVLGTPAQIPEIVRDHGIHRVVVSLADARGCLPMDQLLDMKFNGIAFDHLATVYERYMGKIAIGAVRPSWMIFSSGFRKTEWLLAAKRIIDVVASLMLLILAAPVMALTALAIKLTSRGPALYHQARVGEAGGVFTVHKFRSMRVDAEAATGAVWATPGDARVTRVGRFIRKTRLDELPQLWNVLRGDMSFVGPRPERPEFVEMLAEQIPYYRQRHVVKPGLTGWAQVRYAYGSSIEDAIEKLQYDLYYIKYLSVSLDLFIIFQTIKTVILRQGT